MIEFFQTIGKAIECIFNSIVFVFTNIPYIIQSVTSALQIGILFQYLPPFIAGLATITVVVAIVFLILRIFHG